jgi:hypothetical protein
MYGGQDKLMLAVSRGEVTLSKNDDGVEFATWATAEVGTVTGKATNHSLNSNRKLDKEAYRSFCGLIDGLSWDITLTKAELKSATLGALPPSAIQKLSEALQALRKASVEAKGILSKLEEASQLSPGAQAQKDALTKGLKELFERIHDLNHVETFHMLPSGKAISVQALKDLLANAAKTLMTCFETAELSKTIIRLC